MSPMRAVVFDWYSYGATRNSSCDDDSLARPEVRDVDVGSPPNAVGEVPSDVIRVLVDHDVVRIPEPVIDEAVFERGHAEVVAVEPETLPAPSLQPEDVATTEAGGEA